MNFDAIKKAAEGYEKDMTKFLRDLVAIPSESAQEEGVAKRILAEMENLQFDKAEIDPMGNVLGWMGDGDKIIAYDGHIDTVGLGEMSNWTFDPYEGYETDTEIGGRGTSDQEGGLVSAVYGAKIMKDLDLIPDGYKILVTGTVQEEDCDGLCWQYIHNELGIKPEFVVITEPTDKGIYRGQRGRMEIRVEVKGVSCHGSAPERGDNAIYKMADIITEIRDLNDRLHYDEFLGKGTVTVSQSFYNSPSRCAVADMAAVSLDRRLTDGETWESALEEVRALP
ncbi:MAG: YgeY family selenium metabolism-linked hydrolase, partial [Eubacteriales bacterium]|nr:YgeY family selenium metabolism-linked hydrolase [Eubacteriales bacterium]